MIADITPRRVVIEPGTPAFLVVSVTNTTNVIAGFEIAVLGLDPDWVEILDGPLSLFPADAGTATIIVNLPAGTPAGTRSLVVEVRDTTARRVEPLEVELTVPQRHAASIQLDPAAISAGTRAKVGIVLDNSGNGREQLVLVGTDDDEAVTYRFHPPLVQLEPGERAVATAEVSAKRPLTGSPKIRTLHVSARLADGRSVMTIGSFVQRPRISRGTLGLAGLLIAISVFAGVIATTFGRVADRSAADRNLLLDALHEGDAVAGDPGGITGLVTLLTSGLPADGVTLDAFPTDDLASAAATTASDSSGAFTLDGLPAGAYKVRARGAGFIDVWYPLALDPKTGTEVEVQSGETARGVDIRVGGVPASLAGSVGGDDPSGATVSIRVPAGSIAGVPVTIGPDGTVDRGPVVASAPTDATGAFAIADIPSPATYEVTVEKKGFATGSQLINLAAGEAREGISLDLRTGDGTISGRINDANGPLGGAAITATDGTSSASTVSLTRDDVGGYTLRSLPTPGTYTLVITKEGYTTTTLTVNLASKATRTGVDTTLISGAGTISGTVQVAGVGPSGGVRVRASDGVHTVETVSLSTGDIGAYHLTGLAVPSTYTVTFERSDLARQTRAVTVDAFGRRDVTGENVSMIGSTGIVKGVVSDDVGVPVGNVTIALTAGDRAFRTTSADDPPGAYELRGIPPGTYSISFTRGGAAPTGLLANVTAGGTVTLNAVLIPRSSIQGTVYQLFNGSPATIQGAKVRLYAQADYPGGPERRSVTTDAVGHYEFADLDGPAIYIVDYAYASGPPQTSRQVPVDAGEQIDLDHPPASPGPEYIQVVLIP